MPEVNASLPVGLQANLFGAAQRLHIQHGPTDLVIDADGPDRQQVLDGPPALRHAALARVPGSQLLSPPFLFLFLLLFLLLLHLLLRLLCICFSFAFLFSFPLAVCTLCL